MATEASKLIGVYALAYYLKRICAFLESDKKLLAFPLVTPELQEILMRIVAENPEFLNSAEYSNAVRQQGAYLATALKAHVNFNLTYEISDGKHGTNVLTYKKMPVNTAPSQVPAPLKPLREVKQSCIPPENGTVSSMFKTNCLNLATKFVKDDSRLKLLFPEMSPEQAEFVVNMILPGIEGNAENTEVGFGYRSMYAPLWESMRLFSLKYTYEIEAHNRKIATEGMKRVVFEKIPKFKKPEVAKLETTDPVNNIFSSTSTTSTNSQAAAKSKTPKVKKPKKSHAEKLIHKVGCKIRQGTLSEKFIQNALRKLSDFMFDDQMDTVVFDKINRPQVQFIEVARNLSLNTDSYMLFSSESQKYLDNIKYCLNVRGLQYTTRRVNGDKDPYVTDKSVILDKVKDWNKSETEVEVSVSSHTSTTSVRSAMAINSQDGPRPSKAVRKVLNIIGPKMIKGQISEEFIETTLSKIHDFLNDEQQGSLMLKQMDATHQYFIQHLRQLARSESAYAIFSLKSRQLLAQIKHSLQDSVVYELKLCKGGKDMILEKLAVFPTKKLPNETSNNENVNILNTPVHPCTPPLSPADQERLIQLKAIKDKCTRTNGELTVRNLLQDISRFLTLSNTDRSITFDDVTEDEAVFLKHVHIMSKTDEAYTMFPRESQKLLRSIRSNARSYKLTFQMIVDVDREGYRTVVIEKHVLSTGENEQAKKEQVVSIEKQLSPTGENQQTKIEQNTGPLDSKYHHAVKNLYMDCRQTLEKTDRIGQQHRARSLSAGRRLPRSAVTLNAEPARRGTSSQRLSVKDKLKAALAQPVQSTIALKMMENMGWKGGALGLRGEGIVEPIALPLDLVTRAGLGHVPTPKKPKPPKPEPKKAVPPKRESSATTLTTASAAQLLPQGVLPVPLLLGHLVPPGIQPTGLPQKSKVISLNSNYHLAILSGILKIVTQDIDVICFLPPTNGTMSKINGFVKHAVKTFNSRSRLGMNDKTQLELVRQISHVFAETRGLQLESKLRDRTIFIKRIKLIPILNKTKISEEVEYKQLIINSKNQTTNYQESNYKQEKTIDGHETTTTNSRQWYLPVKSIKKQDVMTTETTEIKTKKTQLMELKLLALCKVKRLMGAAVTEHEQKTPVTQEMEIAQVPEISKAISSPSTSLCNLKRKQTEVIRSEEITITGKSVNRKNQKSRGIETPKPQVPERPNAQSSSSTSFCDLQRMRKEKDSNESIEANKHKPSIKIKDIEIPNMTRKQLSILNEQGITTDMNELKTTYRLRVEKYELNNIKQTDVKVTKNPPEWRPSELKRRRTNSQEEVELDSTKANLETTSTKTKTPGEILLEKLTLNSNYSAQNNNNPVKKDKGKTSVTVRLQNVIYESNVTDDLAQENVISRNNTTNENTPIIAKNSNTPEKNNSTSPVSKTVTANAKDEQTIDLTKETAKNDETNKVSDDKNLICKRTENIIITETVPNNKSNTGRTENDTINVTYIVPVDNKETTIVPANFNTTQQSVKNKTIEDKRDQNENDTSSENKNTQHGVATNVGTEIDLSDKDDYCEIVLDDSVSTIVINSEDETLLLNSDEEIEVPKRLILYRKDKCKKAPKGLESDVTESGSDDFYDSIDIPVKLKNELSSPPLVKERKRSSCDRDLTPPRYASKKCKSVSDFKRVCIQPKNYPETKIDILKAREIQSSILKAIDYTRETLPHLKCNGIQNGGLIYSCQDEKSLFFLENLMKSIDDLKLIYEFDDHVKSSHKMALKINSYINEPVYNVLNRLELYNTGLNATKWVVIKTERYDDFVVIYLEVDESSFNYVCYSNFVLYAGNDCAQFTIVWD